ncbi:MAG: AAA family ATPase, partial [Dehalococcoidia bacterium]
MAEPRPSAPTIVGRASELTVIREALSGSLSGRPTAVLVAGEAGVGKSRLIREARREQPFATWTILETFALPDQGAPAYFATARLVNRASRVQHVDPDLVHEVESALQGVRAGPSLAHAGSGAEGRFRLLDAMVRLVESAARERPLLITFDDMQWASEADWTVIGHLIRSAEAPLALMIAARDERLWHAASPALSTLLELNRERSLTQVSLTPLSAGHLSLLCRELTGGLPSGSVADALFERTGGNPFLTEELLGHLLRQGALSVTGESLEFTSDHAARLSMPPTVRLTTSRLLESLDGAAREVLEVAAVCGRVFTEDGLGAAGCPPAAVRLALADGQAAGLVMPAGVDWTFRHDLIREAVLATVEAARRVTLHRRLAEVLLDDNVRVSDGSRFSRLAAAVHHWQAADEPARAFDAASEASRLASHAFAPDDALRFAVVAHECALELAVPGGGGDTRLVTALEIRGDAELDAGLYIPAEARFEELLEKAIALGDERLAGTALLRMGLVWRRREDPQKAAAYLTRAISMLEPMPGEGRSIARALVELSNIEG